MCICVCVCTYNVYVCAQITSCRFATGRQKYETFFFRNNFYKEALARAPIPHARPKLYIYIYTRACNAFSTRSFCGFQRSVHARSSHQLEIRDLKNRAIDHPPLSFTAFLRQPAGEKSRGIFKFRRSPSFCLPPRFSRTPIHLFYTLLLRAEFVLVRWKIRMAHDQPIITKIFFRVKVEKAIWLWLVMIVDCNWLCSSLI